MAPPTATAIDIYFDLITIPGPGYDKPDSQPDDTVTHEPVDIQVKPIVQMQDFSSPPKIEDPYEEREDLKRRLVLAFSVCGKFGFDESVAGHITLRDPPTPPPSRSTHSASP